ncbi:hypothetical protein BP6252_09489 [Coleophoma cylindrospora]|uniref:DUF7371 domain-containing protein n=1 Tax=Coleophoma cylindrospora TaxID=1849047 RepID=A0A3D8R224_9HELO|nr:hypothetical protein BP6252_09489 [Coleophoma cylindrospora]
MLTAGAPAISYAAANSICGVSTVTILATATANVSASTVYVSLPANSAVSFETTSVVTVTVAATPEPTTVYETLSYVNVPDTSTVYVTLSDYGITTAKSSSQVSTTRTSTLRSTLTLHQSYTKTVTEPSISVLPSGGGNEYPETSTIYATNVVTLSPCASGVACPYGVKTMESTATTNLDAIRQTNSAFATTKDATNGYYSFFVEGTSTVWLNGHTPDASQSYVVLTTAVTVVPFYTTPQYDTTNILAVQSSGSKAFSTMLEDIMTSAPYTDSTTALTTTIRSTIHVTTIIETSSTSNFQGSASSIGIGATYTGIAIGGWNSTTSTSKDRPIPTSVPIGTVASVTAITTSGASYDHTPNPALSPTSIPSLATYGVSKISGNSPTNSSSTGIVSTTYGGLLNATSYPSAGPFASPSTSACTTWSSSENGTTGTSNYFGSTSMSSAMSSAVRSTSAFYPIDYRNASKTAPDYLPAAVSTTTSAISAYYSAILPSQNTTSSVSSSTSDSSPISISSMISASGPIYYAVLGPLNSTSTLTAASLTASTTQSATLELYYPSNSSASITSVVSITSDNSPLSTSTAQNFTSPGYYPSSLSMHSSTFPASISSTDSANSAGATSSILASAPSYYTSMVFSNSTSPTSSLSMASSYYSVTAAVNTTSVSSSPSASPTICGEQGDFTLTFDDTPVLAIDNSTDPTAVEGAPVFNPYHQFIFSDGFTVVPPPTDPFFPKSGKQLLEFIPNLNINGTNPRAGPNTDELGYSGGISDGDHGITGCFTFNFYGAALGCESTGSDCDFTFSGYQLNSNHTDVVPVAVQDHTIPACSALNGCPLYPVVVDNTFQNLTTIRINVTVAGVPKIWWMDDLHLGWYDNSCATGLCRLNSHVRR